MYVNLSLERSTIPTLNLSPKDFSVAYSNESITSCNRGGTAIFTSDMESLLLVKSVVSGKWGLPKGIRDPVKDKNDLITALRETGEETGFNVQLATPLLPSIVVEDAKIYGLILSKTTLFRPEEKEISKIEWFNITYLTECTKKKNDEFTRMLRVFILRKKMSRLQNKMGTYKTNYTMVEGIINNDIYKMLTCIDASKKSILQKAYEKYIYIHKTYPGVFSQNDIIMCIRSL